MPRPRLVDRTRQRTALLGLPLALPLALLATGCAVHIARSHGSAQTGVNGSSPQALDSASWVAPRRADRSTPSGPPQGEQAPIGSSRGARVAVAHPHQLGRKLVFVTTPRNDATMTAWRKAAPGVEFVVARSLNDAMQHAATADAIDGRFCRPEFLRQAKRLRWVQVGSAGVDRYVSIPELRANPELVLTNMQGMHGPSIADHSIAMLLSLTRALPAYHAAQREQRWDRSPGANTTELNGQTLLVVGLGGIGREIARRGKGFGMRVFGTVRTKREPPPYVDRLEAGDALDELLPQADVIALAVPLTDSTRGLFNADRFARCKRGAILINIARGAVVDTDAMVEALRSGQLGGAGLDVTDPEPLPAGHPLWSFDNVLITPHVAGRSAGTGERREALSVENLRRFSAGQPLLNVVDVKAGY